MKAEKLDFFQYAKGALSEFRPRTAYSHHMTRDRALAMLQQLRASLEARGIAHAALFSSVARGQGCSDSDVDVVITSAEGRRRIMRAWL